MNRLDDIATWRGHQRQEMLARRAAVTPEDRLAWNDAITQLLIEGFPCLEGMVIGFCWPFRAEFDARHAMRHFRARGAVTALPVVVRKAAPLEFRMWAPGTPTAAGVFGLPVPQGTPVARPDALLIPPVGFGSQGYRLGYGGGYFDRTLAAMTPQPLKIGVAFEVSRMPTIHPQPHDVPMDFILTERGIHHVSPSGLRRLDTAAEARRIVAALSRDRSRAARERADRTASEPMTPDELVALLDTLLEAERAGAKAIAAYMSGYEPGTRLWLRLNTVQRDEAMNCAALIELIRGLGATPSTATGDFARKAAAIHGDDERLAFLNRGQNWVAQLIRRSLKRVGDPVVKRALKAMLLSHLMNIDRCSRLISNK